MNEPEIKNKAGGEIVVGVFIAIIILVFIFGWAPVGHYLGKWANYWNNKDNSSVQVTFDDNAIFSAESAASDKCSKEAIQAYGTPLASVYASSTDNSGFKTYDCYATPMKKVGNESTVLRNRPRVGIGATVTPY